MRFPHAAPVPKDLLNSGIRTPTADPISPRSRDDDAAFVVKPSAKEVELRMMQTKKSLDNMDAQRVENEVNRIEDTVKKTLKMLMSMKSENVGSKDTASSKDKRTRSGPNGTPHEAESRSPEARSQELPLKEDDQEDDWLFQQHATRFLELSKHVQRVMAVTQDQRVATAGLKKSFTALGSELLSMVDPCQLLPSPSSCASPFSMDSFSSTTSATSPLELPEHEREYSLNDHVSKEAKQRTQSMAQLAHSLIELDSRRDLSTQFKTTDDALAAMIHSLDKTLIPMETVKIRMRQRRQLKVDYERQLAKYKSAKRSGMSETKLSTKRRKLLQVQEVFFAATNDLLKSFALYEVQRDTIVKKELDMFRQAQADFFSRGLEAFSAFEKSEHKSEASQNKDEDCSLRAQELYEHLSEEFRDRCLSSEVKSLLGMHESGTAQSASNVKVGLMKKGHAQADGKDKGSKSKEPTGVHGHTIDAMNGEMAEHPTYRFCDIVVQPSRDLPPADGAGLVSSERSAESLLLAPSPRLRGFSSPRSSTSSTASPVSQSNTPPSKSKPSKLPSACHPLEPSSSPPAFFPPSPAEIPTSQAQLRIQQQSNANLLRQTSFLRPPFHEGEMISPLSAAPNHSFATSSKGITSVTQGPATRFFPIKQPTPPPDAPRTGISRSPSMRKLANHSSVVGSTSPFQPLTPFTPTPPSNTPATSTPPLGGAKAGFNGVLNHSGGVVSTFVPPLSLGGTTAGVRKASSTATGARQLLSVKVDSSSPIASSNSNKVSNQQPAPTESTQRKESGPLKSLSENHPWEEQDCLAPEQELGQPQKSWNNEDNGLGSVSDGSSDSGERKGRQRGREVSPKSSSGQSSLSSSPVYQQRSSCSPPLHPSTSSPRPAVMRRRSYRQKEPWSPSYATDRPLRRGSLGNGDNEKLHHHVPVMSNAILEETNMRTISSGPVSASPRGLQTGYHGDFED